jgi:hypothetical protein
LKTAIEIAPPLSLPRSVIPQKFDRDMYEIYNCYRIDTRMIFISHGRGGSMTPKRAGKKAKLIRIDDELDRLIAQYVEHTQRERPGETFTYSDAVRRLLYKGLSAEVGPPIPTSAPSAKAKRSPKGKG